MVIVCARVTLHLPASQSLKDKRQVMKSLLAQVQRQFHVSAAEVADHDLLQIGVIGLACVANETGHGDAVIAAAVRFLDASQHESVMTHYETEVVHVW